MFFFTSFPDGPRLRQCLSLKQCGSNWKSLSQSITGLSRVESLGTSLPTLLVPIRMDARESESNISLAPIYLHLALKIQTLTFLGKDIVPPVPGYYDT